MTATYSRDDVTTGPWNEVAEGIWQLVQQGVLEPVRDEHGDPVRRPNRETGAMETGRGVVET